ncbi:MAG: flippase-like domain-containing protein [Anaerolineales bacterium]|nr:flippase-like domain-containing protein [Anaerolineales bacterium]
MKKRPLWIGVILSLMVIGYVLLKLDWQEVSLTLVSLKWIWVLLAFTVYLVNYLLRTIRFRILLTIEDIPFQQMMGVTNLYGMYLYLMPAKFGEITFPVLLKRKLNIDLSTGTGSLIVARVFDFLTIALILPVVLLIYWSLIPDHFQIAALLFCLLVFSFFVFFIWMLRNPRRILPWMEKELSNRPIIEKFQEFVVGVYQGARVIDQRQQYWHLLLVTMGIWICINANFYLITLALGYSINFLQIVVVSIIMVPVTLFPIQGFANLGAHELGWVTAFTLFDYSYQDALNIAVSSHIIYVMFVLLLGSLGTVMINIRQDK